MQDLNDKVTGGTLTAVEWNEVPSELQNVITALGISLTSGDLNQLGKAIAGYVANGTFYSATGTNAYVLSGIGSKQTAPEYTNGFQVQFKIPNTNTGASTVNVTGLGVKAITTALGTALVGGELVSGEQTILVFNSLNDRFEILDIGGAGATGGGADKVFFENDIVVNNNYTITTNKNATTAGPISIADGVTVTVPTGSSWVVVGG